MKFCDVMIYYNYKMTNVARALHVSRQTVERWKRNDKIPFDKQCVLEVITEGTLKSNKEDDK